MYSLQTLTFGMMFMRLYDYLSQEQTSGFIDNKVPYFCAIRNGGFHIYIYIYVKNILGCKLSMHFTNNQRMFFFPLRQVRFTYIYIYIHVFVLLPPKHRTEFIIFEHRYVVLGPNLANLECVHMIIRYHMCSWAL